MIVQHNIMAINAHRQLGVNNKALANNLEKLSSGYRINKAADDAAGLAISEKMRAQITAIDRAVLNAQDGASLIQTAEGALTEVHSMLNRMVELATQSANGTIQADDRQKIESEVNALKAEIDRISKATNFNGIDLLNGKLSTEGTGVAGLPSTSFSLKTEAATKGIYTFKDPALATAKTVVEGDKIGISIGLSDGKTYTVEATVSEDGKSLLDADGNVMVTLTAKDKVAAADLKALVKAAVPKMTELAKDFTINTDGTEFKNKVAGGKDNAPQILGMSYSVNGTPVEIALDPAVAKTTAGEDAIKYFEPSDFTPFDGANEDDAVFSIAGKKFVFIEASTAGNKEFVEAIKKLEDAGVNVIIGDGTVADKEAGIDLAALFSRKSGHDITWNDTDSRFEVNPKVEQKGLVLQVGDTSADFNKITVSIDDMSSKGLGIDGISMATQQLASDAMADIKAAIEKVSVNRGNLGALQNRLDHTINNLNVTSENMTAAESRIRDVDMAKEMMAFTKNNVLSQAAQAMLAQANQLPQQVLQLLR